MSTEPLNQIVMDDVPDVEITPPSFRLQMKVGGSAAKVLTPLTMQKAQKALVEAAPELNDEVARLMSELEAAVRYRAADARDIIWKNAHELRGLAGTVGKRSLGLAADLMCRYLNGTPSNFQADPSVLSTIAVVAMHAVKDGADQDPMIKTLLTDSARAVAIQRKREGRGLAD